MLWDAGALNPHRASSAKFRYISGNPPPHPQWPHDWREEFGIFCHTPGVTWRWIQKNFNISHDRIYSVRQFTQHLAHLGYENVLSATHDDALMYVRNKPADGGLIPFWAKPFIVEDLKNGMEWRQVAKKWKISQATVKKFLDGRMNDVLYFSEKRRRGRFVGR